MLTVDGNDVFTLSPTHRMQWEEAQQSDVLLYPEGVITLDHNHSAILRACDGSRSVAMVVAELETRYGISDLTEDVVAFLARAWERGWIEPRRHSVPPSS